LEKFNKKLALGEEKLLIESPILKFIIKRFHILILILKFVGAKLKKDYNSYVSSTFER